MGAFYLECYHTGLGPGLVTAAAPWLHCPKFGGAAVTACRGTDKLLVWFQRHYWYGRQSHNIRRVKLRLSS